MHPYYSPITPALSYKGEKQKQRHWIPDQVGDDSRGKTVGRVSPELVEGSKGVTRQFPFHAAVGLRYANPTYKNFFFVSIPHPK